MITRSAKFLFLMLWKDFFSAFAKEHARVADHRGSRQFHRFSKEEKCNQQRQRKMSEYNVCWIIWLKEKQALEYELFLPLLGIGNNFRLRC